MLRTSSEPAELGSGPVAADLEAKERLTTKRAVIRRARGSTV